MAAAMVTTHPRALRRRACVCGSRDSGFCVYAAASLQGSSAAGWNGVPGSLGTTSEAVSIGVRGYPGCAVVLQANSHVPASSATGSVVTSSTSP